MKRKNIVLSVIAVILTAFSVALFAAEPGWKLISVSDYSQKVYTAGFRDTLNGITVGYGGNAHFTTDSGKSWPEGNLKSACRFGLEILDATNAWNCGNYGHVRVSHDGGSNWTELTSFGSMEPDECRFLSFIDPSTGWIGSPALLAMTTDGAKTWNELKLPEGIKNAVAMNLLSANQGYVLNQDGILFITKDAGKTWSKIQVDMKGRDSFAGFLLPIVPIASLRFQNEKQGTIVILTTSTERLWLVLQTEDGGKTWKSESLPPEAAKLYGSVYLSRDGKFLTINDSLNNKIYLLSRQ